ncbi:hypothetical protein [Guptibacillus algicola]|uniref:hypothetical protein n=1 Tax=Guptibacillus algicola TaxID=225844 RepID=UPI001CD5144C|nr:hypothetical protein [Alkalihalobacillus algicola]MCA0989093.1 hypothetical protein [Alkalihalobacillus algicola]
MNSSLEMIRKINGITALKSHFTTLIEQDRKLAALQVNDEEVSFPTLYTLSSLITTNQLTKYLSDRNKVALALRKDILAKERSPATPFPYSICETPQLIHSVLKWIVDTGANENLNSKYRFVLDRSAGLLTTIYHDPTDLPAVSQLLFKRNHDSHQTHYLTWAYFSSQNFSCLLPIGERLASGDEAEKEFALELLHFIPGIDEAKEPYVHFRNWYEENLPYLVLNEDSYEMTAQLEPYCVDYMLKYKEQQTNTRYHDEEFKALPSETQKILGDFSYKLRKYSRSEWKEWLNRPLDAQVQSIEEVNHDTYRR